ncbi:MAG: ribonuclease III family protein, partial [Myxococcota bacterium]
MSEPGARGEAALEEALGHVFADPNLLQLALTHPSRSHEEDGTRGNERLEFLGDAVLDLVVGELLYESHPGWPEGHLSRARAALVNTSALALRARSLDVGTYI